MSHDSWKQRAKTLKRDIGAVYLCSRDPRTPWYAKVLALLILAYALSPLDLIPDFIPVLGYLDDLVLLPLAVVLLIKLVPDGLVREFREKAGTMEWSDGRSWPGALLVVAAWVVCAAVAGGLLAYACRSFG